MRVDAWAFKAQRLLLTRSDTNSQVGRGTDLEDSLTQRVKALGKKGEKRPEVNDFLSYLTTAHTQTHKQTYLKGKKKEEGE